MNHFDGQNSKIDGLGEWRIDTKREEKMVENLYNPGLLIDLINVPSFVKLTKKYLIII